MRTYKRTLQKNPQNLVFFFKTPFLLCMCLLVRATAVSQDSEVALLSFEKARGWPTLVLLKVFSGFYGVFFGFYGVLLGFYGVLLGFYGVLLGFYCVLLVFLGFYLVFWCFIGSWVLLFWWFFLLGLTVWYLLGFILGADATGRLRRLGSNLGARGPRCICQQLSWLHVGAGAIMLDPSWAMLDPCWGYVELCWDHVGSGSVKIGARLAHLGAMLGLWLAEWVYVGPFWSFVGAMLAHLGSMLGWSSPILSYVG